MEYNTERDPLIIREYGRNIQKLIESVVAIEDIEERTKAAKGVIKIMSQLYPDQKYQQDYLDLRRSRSADYWHKLWDHMYIMSDYMLELSTPVVEPPVRDPERKIVKHQYNRDKIMFRNYGRNIENVIKLVASYPESYRNKWAVELANYLKKSYIIQNKSSVKDHVLIDHLRELSEGKIDLPSDTVLESTHNLMKSVNYSPRGHASTSGRQRKKKYRRRNGTSPRNY